ncbi:hypothetical protein P43SY_008626 [Pythium insidiosum]|uniref:PX domain-containing protein n=1 Tax=Pythium insidiosum TaxID=114742 RepID=A0AAD5L903_PYTIN|nr:hypothetical protein P43SY_008626 [Pythium insidiosum]
MPATVDRVSESTGAEFDIPEEIASLFQSSSKWEPFSFKSCELREATVRMDERETTATDAPRRVQQVYHVVVPDSSSLALTLELCQAGLSVPQITRSLQAVDHHLRARGASLLAWEDLVQHYVELGCFRSLTMLASLLSKCWAFSISLHAVSSSSSECVDVRLHLCTPQTVSYLLTRLSIHALDILPQLLTILHPKWRDALLSVGNPESRGTYLKKHTTFLVTEERSNSQVRRRFSDFEWLQAVLKARYVGMLLPSLPEKSVLMSDAILQTRIRGLSRFLQLVTASPYMRHDPAVVNFLSNTIALAVLHVSLKCDMKIPHRSNERLVSTKNLDYHPLEWGSIYRIAAVEECDSTTHCQVEAPLGFEWQQNLQIEEVSKPLGSHSVDAG